MQLKEINVEAFKKAWFSFEEIQVVQESIRDFNETGISYTLDEVMEDIDKNIFSKAKYQNV